MRRIRVDKGLSLQETADRIAGAAADTVFAEGIEGDLGVANVTLRDVLLFARAFGLTPQQLLADVGVWE